MSDPAATAPQADARPDRYRLWPLLTAFASLVLLGMLGSYEPVAAMLLIIPFAGIAGIVALVLAAVSAAGRRWRNAASMMVLPVAIAITIGYSHSVLPPFQWFGDYVHIVFKRSDYETRIAALQQPAGQRFLVVVWSGFLSNITVVIYDESDKLTNELSDEDATRLGDYGLKCAGNARHITDHYYVCNISW